MQPEHPHQKILDQLLHDPQPGVYTDVPFWIYLQIPAINNSKLTRLDHCPASIYVPQEDTDALRFGRALHVFTLEGPVIFQSLYAVMPECDKRTKEGKAIYADFMAKNLSRIPIKKTEVEMIVGMDASLRSHPYAKTLLSQGQGERTIIWQHDETGALCKCRTDWVPGDDHGIIIDLKGLAEVTERKFVNACIAEDRGYARAAAFYLDGTSKATKKKFDLFAFVCVEKEAPYKVEVYTMEDDMLAWGRQEYYRLMRYYRQLEEAGHFPAYVHGGAVPVYRPGWLKDRTTDQSTPQEDKS